MVDFRSSGRLWLAIVLIALGAAPNARAGGGPENVFLIVNTASWASQTVANHFIELRQIPAINVFYLDWLGGCEGIDGDSFRKAILGPALEAIDKRGLSTQIDYVIYSSDFPFFVDLNRDFIGKQFSEQFPPECSINSATYLWNLVFTKNPLVVDLHINHYMRSFKSDLSTRTVAIPTHGFRSWYGWSTDGELSEAGGQPYMLSTMLAMTSGRGNSVREAVDYLRRSASADGTRPKGTVYFTATDNIRSKKRLEAFPQAIADLKQLGIPSEIVKADMPTGHHDVVGVMMGVQEYLWGRSHNKIMPGAICDNFTSYGGKMLEGSPQSPLSEFLRYGAAGSSGTVNEPFALAEKFPSPNIFVHYARGCSLAESYYQSLFCPAQMLIVGDPLCRPWANIPKILISGVRPGARITGTLSIKPSARFAKAGKIDRFELFADGRRMATCKEGESLNWNSTDEIDGYHELRVVGIEAGPIETQGRTVFPVTVDNHGRNVQITVSPEKAVRWGESLKVHVEAPGMGEIFVVQNGKVLGKVTGAAGDVAVNPQNLGTGPVSLSAIAVNPASPRERVAAIPVPLTVEAAKPLPPLKDAPEKLAPGLVLKLPDNKVVTIQETADPAWLITAGLDPNQPFLLQGYFDVRTEEVYQFQLWHDGDVKLSVDGVALFDGKQGKMQQRFVPVALAPGRHRLSVSGRTGDGKLRILFGGPGALSLSGKTFKHAR